MTLEYGSAPPSTTTKADHVYTTLLGVLAFFLLIGMVTLGALRHEPGVDPQVKATLLIPLAVEGCFLIAMVVVLVIRIGFPTCRRWPTLGLNIVLLIMFPVGTALGVFGLMKVDKRLAMSEGGGSGG